MTPLETLARRLHAWEPNTDTNEFQRRARLLQALWRDERGLPVGSMRGKPRGALIAMPLAEETLANYLDDTIRAVVRREVLDPSKAKGKLFGRPRIFNNLLSSQPLCFNLFGHLAEDLALASAVLAEMTRGRVGSVTALEFEVSPGRGDPAYTGDKSAFDVFVEHTTPEGGRGFLGIEVKYHEGLGDKAAGHRARYDELADAMGCFEPGRRQDLQRKPLQQIWRDHLLAGAVRLVDGYDDGQFVFLSPAGNPRCASAVADYAACLTRQDSFDAWTLERLVAVIGRHSDAAWVDAVHRRYLDFARIDAALGAVPRPGAEPSSGGSIPS